MVVEWNMKKIKFEKYSKYNLMPQKFSIGIDIGTSMIRVVCLAEDGNTLRIVGVGQAEVGS